MNSADSPWQAFESIPGVAAVEIEWKAKLGTHYEAVRPLLRPDGRLASSYPCAVPRGCGCNHDVVIHGNNDIVAVCHCEHGCETFPLKRSDIVIYELDRAALDAAVAKAVGLLRECGAEAGIVGTTRVGIYSPYAGFRFPVYLTIQMELNDFDAVVDALLARSNAPFILLAPTRHLCSAQTEKRLGDRGSGFLPLSENVALSDKRGFRLIRPLEDILAQFRAANLPSPKDDDSRVFFPTPADATWGDVSIRFKDGHTIAVKAKTTSGVFHYAQMGMANRKNGEPTVQWQLLRTFAREHGVLDWNSTDAHRKNQKRRELLATNLRNFFRIEGDPFSLTKDGKGWQARFRVIPDE